VLNFREVKLGGEGTDGGGQSTKSGWGWRGGSRLRILKKARGGWSPSVKRVAIRHG